MQPLNFDSTDVDRVEEFVSQIYSKMHIGAVGPSIRAQITRYVMTPEVGFDDLAYSFDIGYSAEPQDLMIICEVQASTIRRVGEGNDETFGPGEQFLISRPGLPYGGVAHASRLRFTLIDPVVLTRVAATTTQHAHGTVRVLDHRPISAQAARHLQRCIDYVRDSVMANPDARDSPLVVSTASQYLAASVLHTYPNTTTADLVVEDRTDATSDTLRRAVAYIEDDPAADISVADIAAAARVTPRAIQYAFAHHLQTTPMSYLRRVRLDAAHRDLQTADPTHGDTVTTIAARWGFAHPGRFATTYRTTYGQPPSATLHH
jgi:AraC-like DNA-binding protein